MASFFAGGSTPNRTDSIWIIEQKILMALNGISGGGGGGASGATYVGTGSPQGVVTAAPGSIYTDITNPGAPQQWVKETGSGNTGWVQTLA